MGSGRGRPELTEALAGLPDRSIVAVGGIGLTRKPVGACHALAESSRELTLVSFLGSVDVELLLEAGCVAELHSAGVALDGIGLAPRYRAARESGEIEFFEWSEGSMLAAFQAASHGVDSALTRSALGSDLIDANPYLLEVRDPHSEAPIVAARALIPDLAILHMPAVDAAGNAYCEGDLGADGLIARAARRTLVTYERSIESDPGRVAISRLWIDEATHLPGGARPTGCFPDYHVDYDEIQKFAVAREA